MIFLQAEQAVSRKARAPWVSADQVVQRVLVVQSMAAAVLVPRQSLGSGGVD